MEKLSSIPGIGKSSQELLEVAGFLDLESLAKAGVDDLIRELERANGILKIAKRTPTRALVQKWVSTAREMTGVEDDESEDEVSQMPVNYEGNPEVVSMLETAPCAIPLPGKVMMDNRLGVGDIPAAILLNRYSGDLEVRIGNREEPEKPQPAVQPAGDVSISRASIAGGNVQRAAAPDSRLEIDTSRVKTFEEFADAPKRNGAGKSGGEDRVALLRAPRDETNRGRDPKSRWYIRGVLHTHPIALAFGAILTLLLMIVLPLAIVSAALLFTLDQFPASVPWVPRWLIVFPAAMPVLFLLYLSFSVGCKCRICGQRLFYPRNCLKNTKAHRFPGLGHIIPLSLHLLTFRWFRCTYCGTPVRLKK